MAGTEYSTIGWLLFQARPQTPHVAMRRHVSVQDYSFTISPESGSPGGRDRLSQQSIIAAKQTIAALAALAQRRKCPRHLPWLNRVVDKRHKAHSAEESKVLPPPSRRSKWLLLRMCIAYPLSMNGADEEVVIFLQT
ncbi:hypothetical protein CISG_10175 [Coccidioides immitis RMSCC 3703]|uniref:Uncharacterized protein n=1 Tax=Coccidioides immitis RMSCC 3703 TaxID=454286 RepID=A0A0J8QN59_COCIT|nr:hypothetical protein CISG_10175 [Coccidioides immitis RMSCC 3703]